MEIFLTFILFLSVFYFLYILERREEVYKFRLELMNMAYLYHLRHVYEKFNDAYAWFVNKWTFDRMLYSFKPLTLEAWFTEEEIREINR